MRKIVLILVAALLVVSCSMVMMSSNVRKLEVGMTRHQVQNIMGKGYSVVFADDYQAVWGYVNPDPSLRERYVLTFVGDRLKSIETVLDPPPGYVPGMGVPAN